MFNAEKAKEMYLASMKADKMSEHTLKAYGDQIDKYTAFCAANSLDIISPSSVAAYKAEKAANGVKLQTIATYMIYLHSWFDFCERCKLIGDQPTNPVLPDLMPPRKKLRAERKPYEHLMDEHDISEIFNGGIPKGAQKHLYLRNRAIVMTLLGCGLRNTELRMLRVRDLHFASDESATITVWAGKGDKFRPVPFPLPVQQAVKEYLESGNRPEGLTDQDYLFGVGNTRDEWHPMNRDCLSDMCKRYIKSASGFTGARSHACRHAFSSVMLTSGVPMAEIQSLLGHSSIMTTERYATLLRPTAPTGSGNKVFNNMFASIQNV